jgi:hypothetical protein
MLAQWTFFILLALEYRPHLHHRKELDEKLKMTHLPRNTEA